MQTLLDLCAMIPNSFAFVGFGLSILGLFMAYGRNTEGDPALALVDADADHWGEEEDALAGERFYADAA